MKLTVGAVVDGLQESILPNFDFFIFQIFIVKLEDVCTLKWPSLIAKNIKNLRFKKKKVW